MHQETPTSSALTLQSTRRLNNGVEIPRLGLGVFRAGAGAATRDAVRWALAAGYRHIDTASVYGNEQEVGEALRASGVPREEVFITTKLWRADFGYDAALRAFDASLARLGLERLDLYLIHWPGGPRRESWRALEAIARSGRCRAIGVSNFLARHLEHLLETAEIVPAVNQLELHPFLQRAETQAFCERHGIAIEAWAPLTKGRRLDDPTLVAIARELGKSPAQVLLRWSLQRGMITIPKSSHQGRIGENADLFDVALSGEQMARLNALDEGYLTAPGWDPDTVE